MYNEIIIKDLTMPQTRRYNLKQMSCLTINVNFIYYSKQRFD